MERMNNLENTIRNQATMEKVPEDFHRALAATCDFLPEKRKALHGRRTLIFALAAVLVLGLAVGAGASGVLGNLTGIFQKAPNTQGWKNLDVMQESLQRFSVPVEECEVTVPGGLADKEMQVAVREAYYDGEFLYAGLAMSVNESVDSLFDNLEKGYDILLNGESQAAFEDGKGLLYRSDGEATTTAHWEKQDDGRYISLRGFRVPEEYRGRDRLEVTLEYAGIYTRDVLGLEHTVNGREFSLRFSVEKNNAPVRSIDGNGLEMGGIRFVSAVSTPAGTAFTLDFPNSYRNPSHGAKFQDGSAIGPATGRSPSVEIEPGVTRVTKLQAGIAEGDSRKVLYSVFDKNGSDRYAAVFLLDFDQGTATLDTPEAVTENAFVSRGYKLEDTELEKITEGYKITLVSWKEGGNMLSIFVATPNEPRDLTVEIWQDDEMIGSRLNTYGPDGNGFTRDMYREGLHNSPVSLLGMEDLNGDEPVTIRLYDAQTEELLDEETILLTEEAFR